MPKLRIAAISAWVTLALGLSSVALANHPVIVEGNCLNPPTGNPGPVLPGTCADYDGDTRIGTAEDADGDRVFGTITAALGPGTGANQNGRVIVVSSGTFAEVVNITAANGNVTLEAAPGVEANIDAVLQGDPGNAARQNAPGIIINSPADRIVILRNLTVRNWTIGIDIRGDSRVIIENVRVENNTNWGIRVQDNARVTIAKSEVHATGFRVGAMDFPRVNPPAPGVGIEFEGRSSGSIFHTTVASSFRAGVKDSTRGQICLSHVQLFDNHPNRDGAGRNRSDCERHDD